MKFTPKSEKELAEANLLQPGVYDFEVTDAADKVSRNGNDMIELSLRVFLDDGRTVFMRDWILEAFAHKLRHFCEGTGLMRAYQNGTLSADDCVGKAGKVQIEIRERKDSEEKQNGVKDYVVPDAGVVPQPRKPAPAPLSTDAVDDIPF